LDRTTVNKEVSNLFCDGMQRKQRLKPAGFDSKKKSNSNPLPFDKGGQAVKGQKANERTYYSWSVKSQPKMRNRNAIQADPTFGVFRKRVMFLPWKRNSEYSIKDIDTSPTITYKYAWTSSRAESNLPDINCPRRGY